MVQVVPALPSLTLLTPSPQQVILTLIPTTRKASLPAKQGKKQRVKGKGKPAKRKQAKVKRVLENQEDRQKTRMALTQIQMRTLTTPPETMRIPMKKAPEAVENPRVQEARNPRRRAKREEKAQVENPLPVVLPVLQTKMILTPTTEQKVSQGLVERNEAKKVVENPRDALIPKRIRTPLRRTWTLQPLLR